MQTIERTAIEKMDSGTRAIQPMVVKLDDSVFGVSVTSLPADRNVSRGGGCGEERSIGNARREFEEELADFNHDFGLSVEFGPLLQPVVGLTHDQADILASLINRGDGNASVTWPKDGFVSLDWVMENML